MSYTIANQDVCHLRQPMHFYATMDKVGVFEVEFCYMKDIIYQVIAGVLVAAIVSFLGLNSKSGQTLANAKAIKKWKVVLIVGWGLFLFGLFIFVPNFNKGGFQNAFTGLGFVLAFCGFVTICVGRVGCWLNR